MSHKHGIYSAILALTLVVLISVTVLAETGDGFELSWWTVDNGGGSSSGGDYTLSGTIGQPDVGSMAGGEYTLVGGFWNDAVSSLPQRRLYLPLVNR
jgi:hypothetical protein